MSWFLNKFKAAEPTEPVQEETTEVPVEEESSGFGSVLKTVLSAASLGSDVLAAGISLPCSMYEPLSILQRQCEMIEYSEILDAAVGCENSLDRMAYVAAFATSVYSSTERWYTDFNPILGETFEFVDEEKGVKLLTEQVSHHPPITAAHVEGNGWVFWQTSGATTSFQGNSIEIDTKGQSHVYFPATKDHFFYTNPKSKIHNLILGKLWLEHFGDIEITNMKNGEKAFLNFKKAGFFGGVNYKIAGSVQRPSGRKIINLEGEWNSYLNGTWVKTAEEKNLWTVNADNIANEKYGYTRFTEKILQFDDELKALLPPTDSRRRCDRLLVEKNETSRATRIKRTMEDRQREDKKNRLETGEEWTPSMFHSIPNEQGGDIWVYCGDYWEQREMKLEHLRNGNPEEAQKYLTGGIAAGTASDFTSYDV